MVLFFGSLFVVLVFGVTGALGGKISLAEDNLALALMAHAILFLGSGFGVYEGARLILSKPAKGS